MASEIAPIALVSVLALSLGCTVVSGVSELQIQEEGRGTTPSCEPCANSTECVSGNCRIIECVGTDRPMICLPEGASEETTPQDLECDWGNICPQ